MVIIYIGTVSSLYLLSHWLQSTEVVVSLSSRSSVFIRMFVQLRCHRDE